MATTTRQSRMAEGLPPDPLSFPRRSPPGPARSSFGFDPDLSRLPSVRG
jgi:hypothetical protein